MLSVPGKIMGKCISNLISNNVTGHSTNVSEYQWAYKKKLSTELLLVHMTETLRRHIDGKKVNVAVPHQILLEKLRCLGITAVMDT